MALSADLARNTRPSGRNAYKVTNAVQVYAGALVGLNQTTGYLVLWSDTATLVFKGIAERNVLGNTSASPVPECEVNESGCILVNVSVTGVSAITHVGDAVYATDDTTLTLTAATNVKAIGRIVRWHSTTYCDVQLLTPDEYEGLTAHRITQGATSLDLSGAAAVQIVFHAEKACTLRKATLLYSEASSADAGITIKIGKEADDAYYYTGTSEVSKAQWYTKDVTLLATDLAAGDTVLFTSAGSKVGTGEIMLVIEYTIN